MHRRLAAEVARGIEARHQALGGGFFVAGGAIELAGRKQASHPLGHQGGQQLGGGQHVVVDGVGGPQHHALLQPRQGA